MDWILDGLDLGTITPLSHFSVIRQLTANRSYAEAYDNVTVMFAGTPSGLSPAPHGLGRVSDRFRLSPPSDIVGWTMEAAKLEPFEAVALLNDLYSGFDRAIKRHTGAAKVEVIGGALRRVGHWMRTCGRGGRLPLDMRLGKTSAVPGPRVNPQMRSWCRSGAPTRSRRTSPLPSPAALPWTFYPSVQSERTSRNPLRSNSHPSAAAAADHPASDRRRQVPGQQGPADSDPGGPAHRPCDGLCHWAGHAPLHHPRGHGRLHCSSGRLSRRSFHPSACYVGLLLAPPAQAFAPRRLTGGRLCCGFGQVNTASRMESAGLPMRIHCSAVTAAMLRSSAEFNLIPRGLIEIKSKASSPDL